jgi:hypothetical protein
MKLRHLAAVALCLFVGCGGDDPKDLVEEGSKALNSGKYEEAAKDYEKALAGLGSDTTNPEWKRAKMGLIRALIQIDAPRAKKDFLEFAGAAPSKVTDEDFNLIASKLGDARKLDEAIEVLGVGKAAYPESPHLEALGNELVKQAQSSGNASALDSLKGLGYVGGD